MEALTFTVQDMFDAGLHFGHEARRWNPSMRSYIYGVREGIHIIDLRQTYVLFRNALKVLRSIVAGGGRVLFVGRKVQVRDLVRETAKACGQYYVDHRWMGGTLTNWKTVSQSIKKLKSLKKQVESGAFETYTKQEKSRITRELESLEKSLGGVQDMGGAPAAIFMVDVKGEEVALNEAVKLGIPVFGIVDTNADHKKVLYKIPGNDDAKSSVGFCLRWALITIQTALMDEAKAAGINFGKPTDEAPKYLDSTITFDEGSLGAPAA